jgi:16S rRNA U516 pseudouridylate synthase RsuA-like enzyme
LFFLSFIKAKLEKREWSKLNNMAAGIKLKDDPNKLKKSLKLKEKKKERSKKRWYVFTLI